MIKSNKFIGIFLIFSFSFMFVGGIQAVSAKTNATIVKIGALGPLAIIPGDDMQKGASLAVEEINKNGFTVGSTTDISFELITETTSGSTGLPDPQTATTSLRKLIDDDQVVSILGGFRTEVTIAIQAGLGTTPFLGVGSTAPLLTPYFWRVGPINGSELARSVIEFYMFYASSLGIKQITIAREDAIWTTILGGLIKVSLESNPVYNFSFTPDVVIGEAATTADVKSALTPVATAGYSDAILSLFLSPAGKSLTEAWYELKMTQMVAGINVESEAHNYFQSTSGAAYGEINLETLDVDHISAKAQAFRDAYFNKYGKEPTYTSYASYDSVYLIKEAMIKSGNTTAAGVQGGLNGIDYQGTTSKIAFTNEIGPQYSYYANFTPYIVPGFPARGDIVVHDLYTSDNVGTNGNGYANAVFVQWQKNGVKHTVYSTIDTLNTSLVVYPINHADFGTIPGQSSSTSSTSFSTTSSTSSSLTTSNTTIQTNSGFGSVVVLISLVLLPFVRRKIKR